MLYYMDFKSYKRVKRVFGEMSIKYMIISSNANALSIWMRKNPSAYRLVSNAIFSVL